MASSLASRRSLSAAPRRTIRCCSCKPAVTKQRFISGLAQAVEAEPDATYFPLKKNGAPTTARAGIAFPGNDWLAFPAGDQYLVNVGGTPQLVSELAVLRQKHLIAVANLSRAIARDRVDAYLAHGFTCPN